MMRKRKKMRTTMTMSTNRAEREDSSRSEPEVAPDDEGRMVG